MINVKIFRFNPDVDSVAYLQDYLVADDVHDSTVLEVLDLLQRQDPTLRFRRPGHEGIRLADGININGENRLAHTTRLKFALSAGNTLVLRPLTGMQVIRDLVVEILPANARLHSILLARSGYANKSASWALCRDRSVEVA